MSALSECRDRAFAEFLTMWVPTMCDSSLETARGYWRKRNLPELPDYLAKDPRPFRDVLHDWLFDGIHKEKTE